MTGPLYVRTTPLPTVDRSAVLTLLEAGDVVGVDAAWLRDGDGAVAGGVAARWPAEPGDDPDGAQAWWQQVVARLVHVPQSSGRPAAAFAAFVFDPARSAFSPTCVLPEWALLHRHGETVLVEVADDPSACTGAARLEQLLGRAETVLPGPVTLSERTLGPDADDWADRVARGVKEIVAGQLDKVVLARQVTLDSSAPVAAGQLARLLHEEYPRCWTFLVDGLVGASPEMLVRREEGLVTSRVLAGTIGVHGETTPQTLAAALTSSSKDLQEHEFAVTSVAEALAPYCTAMNVPDAPYVLELPNLLHLATDVTAVTRTDTSVLELVAALHPSAAVCGTPTDTARDLIAELEGIDRGRYSAPVGWVDENGDGAFAIALRCGQVSPDGRRVDLYAGCGIVADSDPDTEVAESEAKLVPMRTALRSWADGRCGALRSGAPRDGGAG